MYRTYYYNCDGALSIMADYVSIIEAVRRAMEWELVNGRTAVVKKEEDGVWRVINWKKSED